MPNYPDSLNKAAIFAASTENPLQMGVFCFYILPLGAMQASIQ
jgi:hypothetical protein